MGFSERSGIEEGFAPVFDSEIAPELERLEGMRLEAWKKGRTGFAIATAGGLAIGVALWLIFDAWFLIVFAGFFGLILGFVLRGREESRWKGAVAEVVLPPVLKFVGNLEYSAAAEGGFPLGAMRDLGLFGSYNRVSLSHKLWGTWRGTDFQMVQANLRRKSSSSGGSGSSSSSTKVVFQGLLFDIGVPIRLDTPILIAREYGKLGNQLAGFFAFGKRRGMPKVAFDHDRFEELFEVHADDPEAARRIMPPAFLETLIAIGDAEGGKEGAKSMTAGFEGERFYLALHKGLGFMNVGDVGRTILDIEEALHALFDDLTLIRRIIDRLHGEEPPAAT